MSKYWTKRLAEETDKLVDASIKDLHTLLANDYSIALRNLKVDLVDVYLTILKERKDDKVLVSHLYQYNKYYELINKIQNEMLKLGNKEVYDISRVFKEFYKENIKTISSSFNLQSDIPEETVEEAVNSIWCADGKVWSDRVWEDKRALAENLRQGLVDIVATGRGHKDISKMIAEKFDTSFYNAERLVRTELSYIQNKSALDKYKEAGINKVRILVDPDCCEICAEHKDKVYPIATAPLLPFHPNGRCTYCAVID